LWSTKKLYRAFEKIQVDVKVLTDIANYWPQYLRHKEDFPRYEVTARDVKTGATFVGLMKRNNQTNTATFIYLLGEHLKAQGFDLSKITIQTDNGMEFNAGGQKHSGKTGFTRTVTDTIGVCSIGQYHQLRQHLIQMWRPFTGW
jgi:hypothetical protein